ncbi:hypothetical protein [Bdellovibrio sp. BCCA]
MRLILASLTLLLASSAFAAKDNCQKYFAYDRYMQADQVITSSRCYSGW